MNDFLLQSYLRSVVLGLVGLVAAYFVRRKSASVQHLVLVCCLVAILAIPVIRLAVPEQPLAVFPPIAEVNHVRVVSKLSHLDKAASEPTHEVDNVPSISLDPWLMIWLLGVGLILGRKIAWHHRWRTAIGFFRFSGCAHDRVVGPALCIRAIQLGFLDVGSA